ncbi:hypothetical protein [uncultured Sulfitobacter sp.]|uniref:hypothetical protein n=1 Tax=uncultured Sulfitobacter sp. TaxID=191468 RepID=UPI0026353974|nr:hypothetical protein [uncultured Sulfitobacter sp.]
MSLSAAAAQAGPYDGRYRPLQEIGDSWDCKSIGVEGGAILITSGAFFTVGSRCALRNPTRVVGMDGTLYDAICRADAEPWQRRIMILKTETGIAVLQKGAHISYLRRCE